MTTGQPETQSGPAQTRGDVVLDVKDLRTYLYTKWGITKAVDGLSFQVHEGETLGIVGESGCGKSMTALSLLRLAPKPAARIVSGEINLDGENILERPESEMRFVRGQKISMILQDPMTSLNPVFTVGNQMVEALSMYYREEQSKGLQGRAVDILRRMGVAAPERRVFDYPHQMSGGMKQRVVGAMAISGTPRVLICDEPTTGSRRDHSGPVPAAAQAGAGRDGRLNHLHYTRHGRGGEDVRPRLGHVRRSRRGAG